MAEQVPDTSAAHRLAGDVKAAIVDRQLAGELLHDVERQPRTVAEAGDQARRSVGRFLVARPAAIGLRRDDAAREPALVLGERPHHRAEYVAEGQLLFVVVAESAAAVQVQHERHLPYGRRTKQSVRHRPRAVVRALLKPAIETVRAAPERLDQCETLR